MQNYTPNISYTLVRDDVPEKTSLIHSAEKYRYIFKVVWQDSFLSLEPKSSLLQQFGVFFRGGMAHLAAATPKDETRWELASYPDFLFLLALFPPRWTI